MVKELRGCGFPVSKERAERLMREHGIHARHKRRYKVTTDLKHNLPVAANRLNRDFMSSASNQAWTLDITYLWTDERWLYRAIVLDLFNREVVGWSLKPRMTADLVTDALTMAWFLRKPAVGLMHHSDRGSQYASQTFQSKLKEYGMDGSMSRKSNCRAVGQEEIGNGAPADTDADAPASHACLYSGKDPHDFAEYCSRTEQTRKGLRECHVERRMSA